MDNFIEITFTGSTPEIMDILIANLGEAGYEGFEELDNGLSAYIPEPSYNEAQLTDIAGQFDLHWSKKIIPPTNWNEVWESNFSPVIIHDFCAIRAEFHEPAGQVDHEIIITPKQSFGTGHHATTFMMIEQMRDIDFKGKSVFDFGTGTGVLAILAEKLGAGTLLAIDHDDWSIENSLENVQRNECGKIEIRKAGEIPVKESFDIILANINKNVILLHIVSLADSLTSGGVILISGLLEADRQEMLIKAAEAGLKPEKAIEKNNWICLKFSKL